MLTDDDDMVNVVAFCRSVVVTFLKLLAGVW